MTTRRRRRARPPAALVALGLSAGLAAALPGPAAAAARSRCSAPAGVRTSSPGWAQAVLDADRVWPLTRGTGQRVAVLSSGIDVRNAQLPPSAVAGAADVLRTGGSPTLDCDGRGTFLAGLVAARASPGTTFAGVAPAATVVPVRVVLTEVLDGTRSERGGTGEDLAAGVRAALAADATVICVPVQVRRDAPALRRAIAEAVAAGALVVTGGEPVEQGGQDGRARAPSYPQAYPGVLAVVAVSRQGGAYGTVGGADKAPVPVLRLAAPGEELVSTAAGTPEGGLGHAGPRADPAGAVALVAGVAALVRSYRPELSAEQVARRLVATADPITMTTGSSSTGIGMVDAYQAVTSGLVAARPAAGIVVATPPAADAVADPRTPVALGAAGALLAASGVVALVALTARGARGRARSAASSGAPPP